MLNDVDCFILIPVAIDILLVLEGLETIYFSIKALFIPLELAMSHSSIFCPYPCEFR